jgi:hypothetical protein
MTGDRWRVALLVPSFNTIMENDPVQEALIGAYQGACPAPP